MVGVLRHYFYLAALSPLFLYPKFAWGNQRQSMDRHPSRYPPQENGGVQFQRSLPAWMRYARGELRSPPRNKIRLRGFHPANEGQCEDALAVTLATSRL